jgi:hypothetical protein
MMEAETMDMQLAKEIELRIFEAIESVPGIQDRAPINETIEALLRIIAFTMTHVCPDCRNRMAASLEQSMQAVFNHANSFEEKAAVAAVAVDRYLCGHNARRPQ